MAVVAPPPFKSDLDPWGSGDSAIYPTTSSASMTDIMSYQYPPPPPQNGAEMELPSSGYMPSYSVPPQTSSGMDIRPSPDSGVHHRERSDSFSKSMKLKRSISTPIVGPPLPQAPTQQPPTPQQSTTPDNSVLGLSGEKRRNKLGYHRTSVACGKFSTWGFDSVKIEDPSYAEKLFKATVDAERLGAFHRRTMSKGVV